MFMTTYYQSFHNSTNNTLISSELIIHAMDKSSKLILAENLRRLMDGHPFLSTQQALAKRSGVAQGTISHMLNVDYPSWPKLDSIEMVAHAFGITADELISEEIGDIQSLHFGREMKRIHSELSENPDMLAHFLNTIEAIRGMVSAGGVGNHISTSDLDPTQHGQTKAS